MPPEPTTWPADPHTLAKIEVVRHYLAAWFPILSSWHGRILYIDGFSGPGEYDGGHKGSPIVALETALHHRADLSRTQLLFVFIDDREDRLAHLQRMVAKMTLPDYIKVQLVGSQFDETLRGALDGFDARGTTIAPTFLFIDPFGISQTPYDTIRRFMRNRRCEVLINFMYTAVNRWKDELPRHLDDLFGTHEWAEVVPPDATPATRESALAGLYERQLKAISEYVWTFRMIDIRNHTAYYLFFATHHPLGLSKMKEAMWRISPTGDYSFSDRIAGQQLIFGPDSNVDGLRQILVNAFRGQDVTIESIQRFVLTETGYLERHLKKRTLDPLERDGRIEVLTPRQRRLSYPAGSRIRFRA